MSIFGGPTKGQNAVVRLREELGPILLKNEGEFNRLKIQVNNLKTRVDNLQYWYGLHNGSIGKLEKNVIDLNAYRQRQRRGGDEAPPEAGTEGGRKRKRKTKRRKKRTRRRRRKKRTKRRR